MYLLASGPMLLYMDMMEGHGNVSQFISRSGTVAVFFYQSEGPALLSCSVPTVVFIRIHVPVV